MVNPKLEYIKDLVKNNISDELKKTLNFTLNENNVVIINVKYETLDMVPSLWGQIIRRRIVEILYSFGMRVNEDYKIENELLKQRINELEERLKKYTCGKNHKKYYEKNKEKVMENGANYLQKLKEENPEKLKEYRRTAYLNRKEKLKNIEKEKVEII